MQKKKKMTLEEFQENETPGLLAIYDFTSNIAISNYIDTTAVKIPEACYSSSLLAKTHFLSETYLMNRKRSSMDMGLSYPRRRSSCQNCTSGMGSHTAGCIGNYDGDCLRHSMYLH